jgi:hypothetical protein
MAFLTDDDYKEQVQDSILAAILGNASRPAAELKAQEQMTDYLNVRFDAAAIFAAQGSARNAAVVMYMVDIVLYHLSSRINPGQVPEVRQNRYDDAIKWLQSVTNKLEPNLPKPSGSDEGVKSDVKYGSMPARNPYY